MKRIFYIDTEVSEADNKVYDYGAVSANDDKLHSGSAHEFYAFITKAEYLCGHNIIDHDAKYIEIPTSTKLIDTLYLSPLLFPNKPYHRLLKDDKLQTDELNNPLNDAIKAKELFYDEVNAFQTFDDELKLIYYMLLKDNLYFSAFFEYLDYSAEDDLETAIQVRFADEICENAPLSDIIANSPVELAYCLALISATEEYSLIPRWVQINYPNVDNIMRVLRNTSCHECDYCKSKLNPVTYLGKYFGYPDFRKYNGEPLQENAVTAAVEHKSLLAIFPTGGGKSLTFQIPALMAGETERALTVVISPLQSLMKDQVDNLEKRGIAEAVTINGLLSPIERAEAIDRVESGIASILYISPESLRSVTIERLFLSRHIDRFVIDEAHCFSAWGQDFRVDYLYIGDFIRELQEKKGHGCKIPVSCFTATAKQEVISDIKDYFKEKLDIELELFATNASRTNLRYEVLYRETDEEKYETLRSLIEQKSCPTIVYVSRTKRTRELAEKLCNDGFRARPFNGKMDSSEKQENQKAFINDEVQIIVATSAFGMGVDKSNVKLVIHYDISDSLENYVQEAGRAGRDETLQAECYVLFNDGDLDKHFILLNQTKLSISEIQQVWKAIKDLTRTRPEVCCSPFEVARQAGWDDSVSDIETRVKTAIQALENAGYIKRGKNVPHVYADGILVKSMIEAAEKIDSSFRFENDEERTTAKRIIKSLISSKSIAKAGNADAESRVDYLADRLGIEKSSVIHSIQQMREDGLLADTKDLTAYIQKTNTVNKSMLVLHRFQTLELFLLSYVDADKLCMNYKELNEAALANGIKSSSVNAIKTLFYYWTIRSYIQKKQDQATNKVIIVPKMNIERIRDKRHKSYDIAEFIIKHSSANMETALAEDMLSVGADGSTCILTNTNQEALLILGILKQRNIPAKLIQSIDGFDMYDIAEICYFLKMLNKENISPVISNDQWNSAKDALQRQYSNSSCLPVIMHIIHTFAETNEKKYRTDLEMFLHESKIEDFYTNESGVITISTIHKSKGREFDNVYMLLSNVSLGNDEEKRKLYVGMTRAKTLLHIHYFGDAFDRYAEYATTDEIDLHTYPKPSELILQLSHRDVYLDFFKDKKSLILQLKSGMHLAAKGNRLYVQVNGRLTPVLQFSSKSNETVKQLITSGYAPYDAVIRFICAWKGKDDTTDSAVILADIYFRRNT